MPKFKKPSLWSTGEYGVEIIKATPGYTRNGNEMVTLKLSVEGGQGTIFECLVFTDRTAWRVASFLTAIGIQLKDGDDVDECLFVGRRARVLIDVEMFDGELQNKIKKWLPPKGTTPAPASSSSDTTPLNEKEPRQ
jgi:hypothetical protein